MYYRIGARIVCLTMLFWCVKPSGILAEVPSALEPDYAEAVLSYNAKDYQKALRLLEALEKKAPDLSEALELRALSYRALQNDTGMDQTYQKLIEAKTKEGKDAKEIAPYHFGLGMLRQKEKKIEEATKHFEFALENDFNAGVSHLYLGMFSFQAGQWSKSEEHFKGVLSSGATELKPVAHFYLGQVYGKMEYAGGATDSFISARNSSRAVLNDPESSEEARKIAKQIYDATEKALAPFDKGQFFGSAGAMAGYDSNVLAIPDSTTDATGKSSAVNSFMLGYGYASSPLRWMQFVPSYQGSFPFHLNRDSSSAEYPSHTLSLYGTANPLSRFSYGLKMALSLVLQNESASDTGRFKYSTYSRSFGFGPYLKYSWSPKLVSGLELSFQPRTYVKDGTDSQKRSGTYNTLRIYLKSEQGKKCWNPLLSLKHEGNEQVGSEQQNETDFIEFSNLFHLTGKTDLSAGLNLAFTKYPKRSSGTRNDKLVSLDLALTHKIDARWTGLASGQYTKNTSTDSTNYSYKRFTLTAGASYTF